MHPDRSSFARISTFLCLLLLCVAAIPAGGQEILQSGRPEQLRLPEPPHDMRPEGAIPEGGERVRDSLGRVTSELDEIGAALDIVERYVEDGWAARLHRELFPSLREANGGANAQLRAAAGEARSLETRLQTADRRMAVALRELQALRSQSFLEGAVLRTHLDAMNDHLAARELRGQAGGVAGRLSRAASAAGALADRLERAAADARPARETELRESLQDLLDELDDLGGTVYPEARDGEFDWFTIIDVDVIFQIFEIYSCGGEWVTIMGTPGDDVMSTYADVGTGPDVINGLGGNDHIYGDPSGSGSGNGGADVICGGAGDDRLEGMAGADRLYGGSGSDIIVGWWDDDVLWGGPGRDYLHGLGGSDVLHGGEARDQLFGDGTGEWMDWLYGDAGDDSLYGGGGNDQIFGGEGSDFLYGGDGDDWVLGGPSNGNLFLSGVSAPSVIVTGGPPEFFYECGGPDWDYLWGGDGNDHMYGEGGKDWMIGGEGNDEMHGDYVVSGGDDDCLWGEAGMDLLYGEDQHDTLLGGDDDDQLFGGLSGDTLFGEGGNDAVDGGEGADVVVGDYCVSQPNHVPGQDTLIGGLGPDLLFGQEEDDSMDGGGGTDTCDGGPGNDTATACETEIDVPPPPPAASSERPGARQR